MHPVECVSLEAIDVITVSMLYLSMNEKYLIVSPVENLWEQNLKKKRINLMIFSNEIGKASWFCVGHGFRFLAEYEAIG